MKEQKLKKSANNAKENYYETRRRSVLKKTDRTEEAMDNISEELRWETLDVLFKIESIAKT